MDKECGRIEENKKELEKESVKGGKNQFPSLTAGESKPEMIFDHVRQAEIKAYRVVCKKKGLQGYPLRIIPYQRLE